MKLSPGVNFTNILHTAFALVEIPKSVRRTLMKSSPGINFINVLRTTFACADAKNAIYKKSFVNHPTVSRIIWMAPRVALLGLFILKDYL